MLDSDNHCDVFALPKLNTDTLRALPVVHGWKPRHFKLGDLQLLTTLTVIGCTDSMAPAFLQAVTTEPTMNSNFPSDLPRRNRIHPLVAGAAVAVILASATGIAAMTGLLPSSRAVTAPPAQVATAVGQPASTPLTSAQPLSEQPGTRANAANEQPVHHQHHNASAPRYANDDTYRAAPQPAAPRPVTVNPDAGEVVSVNAVQSPEPTTGLGAVGGAVAGGLLGNQVGQGRGRVLATIAGAVGGGFAGNGIEHAVHKSTTYQVQVRMQDGSYRSFSYNTQPSVQVGERVHVYGDSLSAS
jgi:outer membrane lipoprotein SlyB